MKKVISLMLVLGLGVLLAAGCASTSSSTTSVPESSAASNVGTMAKSSVSVDNAVVGVMVIQSVAGAKASTVANLLYGSDGWWTYTDNYTLTIYTYDYSVKFKAWDANGSEITTLAGIQAVTSSSDISKVWLYVTENITVTGSGSYTIKYGASITDPLKFDYTLGTISGPLVFSSTYGSESFEMTYTYSSVSVSASGYPNGTVSLAIKSNGNQVATADIVFNGTSTCTVQFAGAYTGKYSVNLDTGAATLI